ncbi:MAG: MG2 domain-containing protein [Planctomycetota bacterium]
MRPLRTATALSALLTALIPASLALAGELPDLTPHEEALIAGRFEEAAQVFERSAQGAASPEKDWALYRAGRAWLLAERPAKARAVLEALLRDCPRSPLRFKARALLSEALGATGESTLASRILEEELVRLNGKATRKAVADLLRRQARRLRSRAAEDEKMVPSGKPHPDDLEAQQLLEKAKAYAGDDPALDEERAAVAMKVKQPHKAAEILQRLVDKAPKGEPRLSLELGKALAATNRFLDARLALRLFLGEWVDSPHAPGALMLMGRATRSSYERIQAYTALFEHHPSHALAHDAARAAVDGLRKREDTGRLIALCDRIAARYAGGDLEAEARFTKGEALLSCGRTEEAADVFHAFLKSHGDHPLSVKARTSLPTAAYRAAGMREKREDYPGAAGAYRAFLKAHPVAREAGDAALAVGRCLLRMGDREGAVNAYSRAADRYAAVEARALLKAGDICETLPGRSGDAAELYQRLTQKHPKSPEGATAGRRLEALRCKSVTLDVDRTFRTTEPARITLTTRNVARVAFRLHRLDLEELFRACGNLRGLNGLDLDVVKPDRVWAIDVPGAAPCETVTSELPVPVKGPGAWAIRVEAEGLRARALLLISDVSLVAKHASGEMLAFVRHEPDGIPIQGARILAAVNGRVGAEGTTGPEGVAESRLGTPPGKKSDVDTLACWKGHYAATDLGGFQGLQAEGFRNRGVVYTDRTLYRPGEHVDFRAVLRRGTGTQYVTPVGEKIPVRILDPHGRAVFDEALTCGPFGTVSGGFDLVPSAKGGTWKIQARIAETWSEGTFTVQVYRKPGFLLDIVPDRPSVALGEPIEATLRARTHSGLPLSGIRIEWGAYLSTSRHDLAWAAPMRIEAAPFYGSSFTKGSVVLDARGEARITVASRLARVSRRRTFRILLLATARDTTGAPVHERAAVGVGPTAYLARFSLGGRTFRPDVPASIDLLTRTPDAKPHRAEGEILLQMRGPYGGYFDRWKNPVRTADGGETRVDLGRLDAGSYRIRFVGRDRRGDYVVTERTFSVNLPEKEERYALRLRPEREEVLEGETIRVHVEGENLGGAGLVTVEGEKILRWKVIRFRGNRAVSLDAAGDFAPNAFVKMAVFSGSSLLEGECEIRVSRKLKVEIRPDRETYRPGEEVVLNVRTTDLRDRPVRAAVSLSVVEAFLYRLEPDPTPALHEFFYDFQRRKGVSTVSSVDFCWSMDGVPVDADLLDERERRSRPRDVREVNLETAPAEEPALKTVIGIGGGAGGSFGGRFGGRRNLRAYGGGRHTRGKPIPSATERKRFMPAAFWRADLLTDDNGRLTVRFPLPHNLTKWIVKARACGEGARFGEEETAFLATKALTVELDLPASLVEGDRFSAVAKVRSSRSEERARVAVSASGAEGEKAAAVVASGAGRTGRLIADFTAKPGALFVDVRSLTSGKGGSDALVRRIPVRPGGYAVVKGFGGMGEARTTLNLFLPSDRIRGGDTLRLRVDPGLRFCIADALRELEAYPYGCIEQTVSRFVPAAAALEAYSRLGIADPGLGKRFRAMARRGLERLYNHQGRDGGFGWWRPDRKGVDLRMTAYAFLAMAVAKRHGVPVLEAPYHGARDALLRLQRRTGVSLDQRAFALYALASDDAAPEADLLRTFARRAELDPSGTAALSLALHGSGRKGPALELARSLASSARQGWIPRGGLTRSVEETSGLAVHAMIRSGLEGPEVEIALRRLLALRKGRGWSSTRATGAVVSALCAYLEKSRFGVAGTVLVKLNGKTVGSFPTGGGQTAALPWVEINGAPLVNGENRLEFLPQDGGRFLFAGEFAYRTDEPVRSGSELLDVVREVAVLPPALDGAAESIVAEDAAGARAATERIHARPGDRLRVRLTLKPSEPLTYVLVEDPVPGGAVVIGAAPGSDPDAFEDRGTHAAVFFSRVPREGVTFEYFLRAVCGGEYTALPTRAEPMYRPEGLCQGAQYVLEVSDTDDVQESADILYALAEADWQAGRREAALARYEHLLMAFRLKEAALQRILHRVLEAALALDKPARVVSAFGALAERGATAGLPVDRLIRIASAHGRAGEGEVALGLFRRAVDGIVGALSETTARLGEAGETGVQAIFGVASFSLLLPDGPELASADLERAKALASSEEKEDLVSAASAYFRFPLDHPESREKEKAWAAGLEALIRARAWEACVREAERHARLFSDGEHMDEAMYYRGYAYFARGNLEGALAQARKILGSTFRRPGSEAGPSRFRHNAEHLTAQVFEVRGETEKAVEYYRRAADYITDASRALQELTGVVLKAGGIVSVTPGEAPKLSVEYRNATAVSVQAYPVDLGLYFTIYKGLRNAYRMRLAGIPPVTRFTWNPEGGGDRKRHRAMLPIPGLETGAYLVLLRAAGARTSALVVVSDLTVSTRRFGKRLRVEVRDGKGKPVWGAHVQVAANRQIAGGGYTDPRGVFEVEVQPERIPLEGVLPLEVPAGVLVLATKGNRYGLARGE